MARKTDRTSPVPSATPFFEQLSELSSTDPLTILHDLGLAEPREIEMAKTLQVDPSGLSVRVVEGADMMHLLALGFAKGTEGQLVVPYAVSSS